MPGQMHTWQKNSPVNISLIEKYISDLYLEKDIEILEEPKEQMIAVIGSGPSGMTVAHQLIKKCTTRPGVFGCGDVVRGTSTVVEAVRCGKLTSQAIDKYLKNLKRGVTDWPIELDTET
jgi:NADPH-dependent glutamate synthase beta subunit-like oxidoreductase